MRYKEYKDGGTPPKDKKSYAYNYLISKGLSPIQSAGVVGNLIVESNLDTSIKGTADNKGSQSIAQWHSERKQGLYDFANNQGRKWDNLDTQLDYVLHELNTTHKSAGDALRNAKTVKDATSIITWQYEKPNKQLAHFNERLTNAYRLSGITPEENFQREQQDSGYKFKDLSPLDYNQDQRLSNLETAQENTKFAEQEEANKAQEIKNRLEEKRLYKEQYLALVNQAQVQYVQPIQSAPPPPQEENYFQIGGMAQFKKKSFELKDDRNITQKDNIEVSKPFKNIKEVENSVKDRLEIQEKGSIKKPRSKMYSKKERENFPDEKTKILFDKFREELNPQQYQALLDIQYQQGNPSVNVNSDKGLPFSSRRNFNPFTNEINIPANEYDPSDLINSYISEAAHGNRSLLDVVPQFLVNDIPAYIGDFTNNEERKKDYNKLKNKTLGEMSNKDIEQFNKVEKPSTYTKKGTVEYDTHSLIEPRLRQIYDAGTEDSVNMFNKQFQQGGVIEDDRGQWAFPGEITRINSPNITMKNVIFPVLGISDQTGERILMKPGKEYFFQNTKSVTEFPQTKKQNKRFL
jgi:hypothetical protein